MINFEQWEGFEGRIWKEEVNVRDFIQKNYTPYDGDESFLAGPTEATDKLWGALQKLQKAERAKGGVLDMETEVVSGLTAYGPGYIDENLKDLEQIVGLQTDKPLKRAFMPYGGIKMAEQACTTYGYQPSEELHKIFTDYTRTHNQAVFDAYTPEMKTARHTHIITGLPDTYGRGRIVGDYRRVALYGMDRLIAQKQADKAQKGEKGQYFTPRYVIDMCVKMMNPTVGDKIIDTACGSSGFTVHSIFKVWKDIRRERGLPEGEGFTAAQRVPEETNFVRDNVFAIDFDEKTVRVARTLNLIAGDGQTNVLHLNTLDYSRWNEITKQDDWNDTYNEGFKKLKKLQPKSSSDYSRFQFDLVMANPPFAGDIKENTIISRYELGRSPIGKWQNKVSRDILFIERNLNFLKPGGRMAVVLPQGRFNNSTDRALREYIAERCRILAVVGLHGNVFKPHTGTKTSVLFVQKWDDVLCPKKEDYPIFFATMQKPSKDSSGDKLYLADPETGLPALDRHNHLIVDHDLYQLSYVKQDGTEVTLAPGIAEAFIEFAKREGFSFFR